MAVYPAMGSNAIRKGTMLMLLTVTPNTALDKTYMVEHFTIDRVHRPYETRIVAGGKGVNVARVTHTLGGEALATGFLGGHTGREIRERMALEGLQDAFVEVDGESRLCIAIMDTRARTQTEVNEPGPDIRPEDHARFLETFTPLLDRVDAVAFSGSLPPGLPTAFYRDLIRLAKEKGVRTALDTSGEALALGLEATPDILKPNASEVSALMGRDIETVGDAAEAGRELLARGVQRVAITLGRCGAVAVDQTGSWYAEPPEVEFRSAVGSGDSFLAAFLMVLSEGRLLADALRYAVAAGAANATTYTAGVLERHTVENIAPRVMMTPL